MIISFDDVVDGITNVAVNCGMVFRGSLGAIIRSGSRPVKGFRLVVWIA